MKIRISHPDCPTVYEIREHGNGLCFEIIKNPDKKRSYVHKYNGKTYTTCGDTTGRYPSTLRHAIDMTVGLIQTNPDNTSSIDVDISTELVKMSNYYKQWIDSLRVQVMDDLEELPASDGYFEDDIDDEEAPEDEFIEDDADV